MSDERQPGDDELLRSVQRQAERRADWQAKGERPLARSLALIGALGWLVVAPTLLGVLAGRWLDVRLGQGIFWSATLIFLGLALGCYMAWKRIDREQRE